MSDLVFVIVVLSVEAGFAASVWLVMLRALQEMEQ